MILEQVLVSEPTFEALESVAAIFASLESQCHSKPTNSPPRPQCADTYHLKECDAKESLAQEAKGAKQPFLKQRRRNRRPPHPALPARPLSGRTRVTVYPEPWMLSCKHHIRGSKSFGFY